MPSSNDNNAQLAAILESAVDAIITIDERGTVLSVNPATSILFGYSDDEVVGQNVKMLMPSPYHEQHDGYLTGYHRTGVRKVIGVGREVIGRRKDGSTFPMHLAVSEIKVGDRTLFTGIVRDITDLKEAERRLTQLNEQLEARILERTQQLQEAQSMLVAKERLATLGQVSGGIAHEIRNPLNALRMSAYFLLNAENASPEKIAEHLERIDRQVAMIDNVVTALSDVAKLPEPQRQPLSVQSIVENALQATSIPKQIQIVLDIPDDIPMVSADENQLLIAVRNLLRNAREAMSDRGEISVVSRNIDNRVQISISDSGTGISPEHLDRVMQPLFSTKARGMGLGLAITKTIIEKNSGSLEVESRLGHGATFTITLESAV